MQPHLEQIIVQMRQRRHIWMLAIFDKQQNLTYHWMLQHVSGEWSSAGREAPRHSSQTLHAKNIQHMHLL